MLKNGMPLSLAQAARIFVRYPSPRVMLALLVGLLAIRVTADAPAWADAAIIAAVPVYWAFQEWFLHRFVLHFKPRILLGFRIDPYFARRHREHHAEPGRVGDIFLPVRVILFAFVVNVLLWSLLAPTLGSMITGATAITAMALVYEWIHFLTHTNYPPRSSYYRAICLAHRRHHFKNEHFWFGFVGPQVDRLFGTGPDPTQVETSPTCRTLGVERPEAPPDGTLVGRVSIRPGA